MSNRIYIFTMSELPRLEGIDQLEFYRDKQLIPTFKGWHQALQRKVIVRLFPVTLAIDPVKRTALEMLMHQITRCRHPGITECLEFKEITLQDGRYYCLVSEWFSDESQNDWLIQYGPLNEENAFLIFEHAATVLTHYWNNCHIAHGNLKPKNILIGKDDSLKIDGFGLTTLLMLIAPPELKVNIGTPAFMASELIKDRAQPDYLSDIYALGTTLSYLLTGLPDADHKASPNASHSQKNVSIRIPMSLEMGEIIHRMIAEHRENRFPSWEAVWEAIEKYKKTYENKVDRNKKTQTIKIPVCENNITRMIEIGGGLNSSQVVKENKISKPAVPVAPAAMKSSLKLRTPVPVPKVKVRDTWVPRASRAASGPQIKWIMPAASLTIIIAGVILGYLRFVKGIDVLKPVRSRMALAYYALAGKGNYTLVDKNELNDLMTEAEKPGVIIVTQEVYNLQADGSVTTKDSGAQESKDTPKTDTTPAVQYDWKGTNADRDISQSDTTDKEEDEATSSSVQSDKNIKNDVEQKSNLIQNISEPTESSGSVIETPTGDQRLNALMKRAQKENPSAYLELADYYYNYSIDDRANAFQWYQRAAKYGIPQALLRYGDCLMAGLGTEKDELKAVEAYKKAAEKNNAEAQYRMGECCLNGTGIAVNQQAAFNWFFKAAIVRHKPAIEKLAECYENGIGVKKDLQNAKRWRKELGDSYKKNDDSPPPPPIKKTLKNASVYGGDGKSDLVLYAATAAGFTHGLNCHGCQRNRKGYEPARR